MASIVTLAQAKAHIKLTTSSQDTYIQTLIDSVEDWLSSELGVAFEAGAVTGERTDGDQDILYLLRKPVTVISSVTDMYTEEVIDADEYYVDELGAMRVVTLSTPWLNGRNRYEVDYTGGYGDGLVPTGIKLLILQFVARAFNNRDARVSEGGATGASVSWGDLLTTDTRRMMNAFSLRRFA